MWQDAVFSIGSVVFILALIPSIKGIDKPALQTSITTGTILLVFGITYITMSLWFSSVTTIGTAIMWFVLAVQKRKISSYVRKEGAV